MENTMQTDIPDTGQSQTATATLSSDDDYFASLAASLKLKPPKLPFPSICVDGQLYTAEKKHANGNTSHYSDHFPDIADPHHSLSDYGERLELMGKFWGQDGRVLEFVDERGKYTIARDVEANRRALKAAGFERIDRKTAFTMNKYNGFTLSGDNEALFDAILATPQDENERLFWAVRDTDLKSFNDALERGASIEAIESNPDTENLLRIALRCGSSPDRDQIIRKLLTLVPKDDRHFDHLALHKALSVYMPNDTIIPDLLNAGMRPLDRHHGSGPALLSINPEKTDPVRARKELKLIADAMLKDIDALPNMSPPDKKKQKLLIQAQYKLLDDGFAKGDTKGIKETIAALQAVWKYADEWATESPTKLVQDFLEPLADSSRAPKFMKILKENILQLNGVNDLAREVTTHIVLPQLVLNFARDIGEPLTDEFLHDFSNRASTASIIEKLMPQVRNTLFEGRSLDKIIALSAAWHEQGVVFPDSLKPIRATGDWHALTEQKAYAVPGQPGITIQVLTNDRELREEGKIMAHCVGGGGYTTKCLAGQSHIFSVRKEGQELPLSTLEVAWDGKKFTRLQHLGPRNTWIQEESAAVEKWLKEQLESGAIAANPHTGETQESKSARTRPEIIRVIGAEITQENINSAFKEFCDNALRRGVEFDDKGEIKPDPKNPERALRSRRTELIAGSHSEANKSTSFKDLPADQWLVASGMQDAVKSTMASYTSYARSDYGFDDDDYGDALRRQVRQRQKAAQENAPAAPAELQQGEPRWQGIVRQQHAQRDIAEDNRIR